MVKPKQNHLNQILDNKNKKCRTISYFFLTHFGIHVFCRQNLTFLKHFIIFTCDLIVHFQFDFTIRYVWWGLIFCTHDGKIPKHPHLQFGSFLLKCKVDWNLISNSKSLSWKLCYIIYDKPPSKVHSMNGLEFWEWQVGFFLQLQKQSFILYTVRQARVLRKLDVSREMM
jgi:hypothetical protein